VHAAASGCIGCVWQRSAAPAMVIVWTSLVECLQLCWCIVRH
jgi:hypothetical protein